MQYHRCGLQRAGTLRLDLEHIAFLCHPAHPVEQRASALCRHLSLELLHGLRTQARDLFWRCFGRIEVYQNMPHQKISVGVHGELLINLPAQTLVNDHNVKLLVEGVGRCRQAGGAAADNDQVVHAPPPWVVYLAATGSRAGDDRRNTVLIL